MWPLLLDMTKDESLQCLRKLELEAYSHLVSALRAQGPLDPNKKKFLKESGTFLNISLERHKAEVRRAINDERLTTIAYHASGCKDLPDDWAQEGRRLTPLLPRMAPQTAYSAIADELADVASLHNRTLPPPAATERKRTNFSIQTTANVNCDPATANYHHRLNDTQSRNSEEIKKRRLTENSTLAQHLLGSSPSKPLRHSNPHFIRQRNKPITTLKNRSDMIMQSKSSTNPRLPSNLINHHSGRTKLNILQNISVTPSGITVSKMNSDTNSERRVSNLEFLMEPQSLHAQYYPRRLSTLSSNEHQQHHNYSHPAVSKVPAISSSQVLPANTNVGHVSACPSPAVVFTSSVGNSIQQPNAVNTSKLKMTPSSTKLLVVSNAATVCSTALPISATPGNSTSVTDCSVTKNVCVPVIKNLSKFKIVTSTNSILTPTSLFKSQPQKMITVKAASGTVTSNSATSAAPKKIIPLAQLLSTKGVKVLPLSGSRLLTTNSSGSVSLPKTASSTQQPLYINVSSLNSTAPSPNNHKIAILTPPLTATPVSNASSTSVANSSTVIMTSKRATHDALLSNRDLKSRFPHAESKIISLPESHVRNMRITNVLNEIIPGESFKAKERDELQSNLSTLETKDLNSITDLQQDPQVNLKLDAVEETSMITSPTIAHVATTFINNHNIEETKNNEATITTRVDDNVTTKCDDEKSRMITIVDALHQSNIIQ